MIADIARHRKAKALSHRGHEGPRRKIGARRIPIQETSGVRWGESGPSLG